MEDVTAREGRLLATVAYLTFIGTFIAYFGNMEKKNSFVFYHIRQMLGLLLMLLVAQTSHAYISQALGDVLWISTFILWAIGLYGAIAMKRLPVPFLGKMFQHWFRFVE